VGKCLAQESKFLVLNKKSAWDRGLSVNLAVSDAGLQIRQVFAYVSDREDEIEVLADVFEVTDFAVAECGQLYILDAASRAIWIYDTTQRKIEKIDCISTLFTKPTSITYASGTLYVADGEGAERIYALAELNWQVKYAVDAFPRSDSLSPPQPLLQPFVPIDLAVDDQGNLFALDRNNLALVSFDQTGRLRDVFGQPELQNKQPASMALSRSGLIYVLDPANLKVLQFPARGTAGAVNPAFIDFRQLIGTVLPAGFKPRGLAIDSSGRLYVGEDRPAPIREDDRFIRRFDAAGKYLGVVENFRGAVDELVVDTDNSIFVFRSEVKNKITALKPKLRFAELDGANLVGGRYFSLALDSAQAGTIWHKFTAATETPANAQIQLSFLASDQKQFEINGSRKDLDDFIAGTAGLDEVINADRLRENLRALDQLAWSKPAVNANDALVAATGRYLWVRALLIGNEQQSPAIHSLRVDFPRVSYLRYLPAVYQEDENSRDFLERFLSFFETFFESTETKVRHIARYFDPDAGVTQAEFLRWLSTWVAISVDKGWDDVRLRRLIKRATQIYKYRGTRTAIEEMIEIFLDERPLIVEHQQTSCASWPSGKVDGEFAELRTLYDRLYGADPLCFCVFLKPFPLKTDEQRKAIIRILDSEKPAHTCAGLLVLQPWVQLDTHTYLEINTYLSAPSARLDLGSTMPRDTVLDDPETTGQLERRSRIDSDIRLT